MSQWVPDKSGDESMMNPDIDWKTKVIRIERTLKQLKELTDQLAKKFEFVKLNNGSYDGFKKPLYKLREVCVEVEEDVNQLLKMLPDKRDSSRMLKDNQVKQLTTQVQSQIKRIQTVSSEIHKEMERHYMQVKMSASVISDGSSNQETSEHRNSSQYQMSTLADPQLQRALEEEKECQRLMCEVIEIEKIFSNLSSMINEQRETVDNIVVHVEAVHDLQTSANDQLEKAVMDKESAAKKKYCLIGFGVAILLIVIVMIIIGVKYG